MKANVYIDAFNLYYGALKRTQFRWLDLGKLASLLLKQHTVHRIRYFTARVSPRANKPNQDARQDAYLRALASIPNLTIHYGHYQTNPVRLPLTKPPQNGPKTVEVLRTEEKGSDVNLATYLLLDGFRKDFEMAVVVTNDSDLAEPIRLVQAELGLTVGVYHPHRYPSAKLRKVAAFCRPIRKGPLSASQFPPQVVVDGKTIWKPNKW